MKRKTVIVILAIILALGVFGFLIVISQQAVIVYDSEVISTPAADSSQRIGRVEIIDRDGDGLSDDEETRRVTDPDNSDTDGDDLSDWDEAAHYRTDPLNPDTDGDGFTDGQEVQAGYSPLSKEPLELH